jgi:hypothetical protein
MIKRQTTTIVLYSNRALALILHSSSFHLNSLKYNICISGTQQKKIFLSGVALASLTVPVMWIAVINQNLEPLGMTQVRETGYKKFS